MWEKGESIEFSGKAVAHLANDSNIMSKSGKILLTTHLASEYGFTDVDGVAPSDMLSVKYLLQTGGHTWLAAVVPSCVRVPLFVVHFGSYKF